jgi:hypothetical protein
MDRYLWPGLRVVNSLDRREGLQCFFGLSAGRPAPIEAGAERSQHLEHILDEVIVDLGAFQDDELAPLGGKGGLDLLGAEAQ